jgi:hypothetical protein
MEKIKSPFDPAWLVELAEKQWADEPFIAEALKQCTEGWWDDPGFIYFTDFFYPRDFCLPWFKKQGYFMKHETKGIVQLDMLRNGKIGGIQFLRKKKYLEV